MSVFATKDTVLSHTIVYRKEEKYLLKFLTAKENFSSFHILSNENLKVFGKRYAVHIIYNEFNVDLSFLQLLKTRQRVAEAKNIV